MIGRRFGGAVVVRLIGEGGMGAVYEAENQLLGKRYAIKVVLPELASEPSAVERFFQEARAAAAVDHPRIVSVIDCGYTDDGRPFQMMPFLDGHDLNRHCDEVGAERGHRGRLDVATAAPIFFQILDGLAAAHDRQIVHRDLKGANIHVLEDRTIKILDFGIAKLFDPTLRVMVRTGTFQIVGTPGYMAPEQARGGPVDYRTDLWALGAVFFRVLTGRLPFEGSDPIEIAAKAILTPPPTAIDLMPEVPARLSDILLSCLSANPNERPESARMLAHLLVEGIPDGRAVLERVAAGLLVRSGPGDPTIRPKLETKPKPAEPPPRAAPGSTWAAARPARASSTVKLRRFGRRGWRLPALGAVVTGLALGVTAAMVAKLAERTPPPAGVAGAKPALEPRAAVAVEPASQRPARDEPSGRESPGPAADRETGRGPGTSAGAAQDSTVAPRGEAAVSTTTAAGSISTAETSAGSDRKRNDADEHARRSRTGDGTLVITVNPFAEISINGKRAGSTPFSRELPVGRYRVKLLGPEGKSETTRITIRAGKTTRIDRQWSHE